MADPLDTNGDGVVDDTELLAGFNKPAKKEAVEKNGVVEANGVVEKEEITDEQLIEALSALESQQKQAAGVVCLEYQKLIFGQDVFWPGVDWPMVVL